VIGYRTLMAAAALAAVAGLAAVALAAPPPGSLGTYREWFQGLMRNDTGTSCCDESDGRITDARLTADGWEARTQVDTWVKVPDDKILRGKGNPTGRPVLFWLPATGVLCFVEPVMG
jgi:hypothetical protein